MQLLPDTAKNTPGNVVIAGDWHGNTRWGLHVIGEASKLLEREPAKVILHAGDLGLWPGQARYIAMLSEELARDSMHMWWVDGNHEDHDEIGVLHEGEPGPVPVDKLERIWHLPRGTRWEWHGKKWLAMGGAGSPDWRERIHGVSWWPQEKITALQVMEAISGGPADVLLAHDCPADLYPALGDPPSWWDLVPCVDSAEKLQAITDSVKPSRVFHGHLHHVRDDVFPSSWGTVHVTGLGMDGEDGNWALVNTRTLEHDFR